MFCKHCGNQLAPDAKFCAKCGAPNNDVTYQPTSSGKRLLNYILDVICFYILCFVVGLILGLLGVFNSSNDVYTYEVILNIIGIFSFAAYYLFFEGIWGRTPGKFITRTKVVMRDGSKPDFVHILGRSFARYIPFEAFSFLAGPVGWHDSLSKTLVVPAAYTPEQVRDINPVHKSKTSRIVIIVVVAVVFIAFIGFLASVVLLALNSARGKARDAQRVAHVRQLATTLELYYNEHDVYPQSLQQLAPDYISVLPQAPTPVDGTCTESQNTYRYTPLEGKDDYTLTFCLGAATQGLAAGVHTMSYGGLDATK